MIDLARYRTAVFDCDGVILDSNRLKSDAFRQSLHDEDPELVNAFISYHHAQGGVSRYVKFDYFYRELNPLPDAERASRGRGAPCVCPDGRVSPRS